MKRVNKAFAGINFVPFASAEDAALSHDSRFVEGWLAGFPARWRDRLLSRYHDLHASNRFQANTELRELSEKLRLIRIPLDATDSNICERAAEFAQQSLDFVRFFPDDVALRQQMSSFVVSCGLVPPADDIETAPAIARMSDPMWWRRGLRKLFASAVESSAIALGFVNFKQDLYVSNESLKRRRMQNQRNRSALEGTLMINDEGQEFQLSDLVDRGVANKSIRRGELMARLNGFETCANELGHDGLFLTITCPSRMHKFSKVGKVAIPNDNYDNTTPQQAQAYLSGCWARVRASLKRKGLGVYGFRIAEPHHDGCPHWHIMLFHVAGDRNVILSVFRRYFLADSPNEAGALQHRVKSVVIDKARGSACSYVAKYISKNIDGEAVGDDLYGNKADESARRVDAWASTWRIRQFQQVGGAPVGVWRELRRIKDLPADSPSHLVDAWTATNKVVSEDCTKQADFAAYTKAQGGVFVGRKAAIQLAKEQSGVLGRYGELLPSAPIGVITKGFKALKQGAASLMDWLVRSVRHVWRAVRLSRACPPRTGVNNYTLLDSPALSPSQPRGLAAGEREREPGVLGFVWDLVLPVSGKVLDKERGSLWWDRSLGVCCAC